MYNINFMDAVHLKINGEDIYKEHMKNLIRSYKIRKSISLVKKHASEINFGLCIAGMLTYNQMIRKVMEDKIKLQRCFDEYRRKVNETYGGEA